MQIFIFIYMARNESMSPKKQLVQLKDQQQSNHHFKGLCLPCIDSNSIFSSLNNRSLKQGLIYSSPIKNIFKQQKKEKLNRQSAIKANRQSIFQIKNTELKSKTKRKLTARRLQTDSQLANKSYEVDTYDLKRKISIADKLLKIAQQLGMNQADYRSYMKTQRKSERKTLFQDSKVKQENKNKIVRFKTTQNHEVQNIEKNKKHFGHTKKISNIQQQKQQYIMSALKCNIKLKPMPRVPKKLDLPDKRAKQKREERDNHQFFNKSIRGWTKYGKMQDQYY